METVSLTVSVFFNHVWSERHADTDEDGQEVHAAGGGDGGAVAVADLLHHVKPRGKSGQR